MSSACWLPACSDDSAGDSDNRGGSGSGGAAGSAAGASMGGSGEGPFSRASCSAYCEHYVDVCTKPSVCKEFCDLVEQAAPARCAAEYDAYFECSASAELDCSQALGNTPADTCGRGDVAKCVGGSGCSRFDSIDNLCEKEHPGLVGFICTGADDAGCVALDPGTESRSRCCPAK